jgi:hypothetical protein
MPNLIAKHGYITLHRISFGSESKECRAYNSIQMLANKDHADVQTCVRVFIRTTVLPGSNRMTSTPDNVS